MSDTVSHDNNTNDESRSRLRYWLDAAGYEDYTYSDITGSINHRIDTTLASIFDYIDGLDFGSCFGCIETGIEGMGQCLDGLGARLDKTIDNYTRNPSDDLRDLANSLLDQNDTNIDSEEDILSELPELSEPTQNIRPPPPAYKPTIVPKDFLHQKMETTDVKIRLNKAREIEQVMVRYGNKNYLNVPFESYENPPYIQNVIDRWFVVSESEEIVAKRNLFDELESYYENSRKNNRNSMWFQNRAEWIKFSYLNGFMDPCGFKRFKTIGGFGSEMSAEYSEN